VTQVNEVTDTIQYLQHKHILVLHRQTETWTQTRVTTFELLTITVGPWASLLLY